MAMTIPLGSVMIVGGGDVRMGSVRHPSHGDTRKAMRRKSLSVAFKSLFLVSVLSERRRVWGDDISLAIKRLFEKTQVIQVIIRTCRRK